MKKSISALSLYLIHFYCILLLLPSCSDLHCKEGNNEMTIQSRQTDTMLESVCLNSDFTVFISRSSKDSISIESESNLIKDIITETINGKLVIKTADNACLNPRKPIIIRVFASNLKELELNGSGSITSDTLISEALALNISGSGNIRSAVKTQNLKVVMSGSGNLELWGKAGEARMDNSGSGSIESYGLDLDTCHTRLTGSGNVFTYVKEKLYASIAGSGSVYYKGKPELEQNISGSGKVMNQLKRTLQSYSGRGSYNSSSPRSLYTIY
ncbi:MAG: DUF2807 domain-containing protein [Bacteroidetes bacterium]|nr:DUF2807 domain-containing protein [Bacteroidota bacterium]